MPSAVPIPVPLSFDKDEKEEKKEVLSENLNVEDKKVEEIEKPQIKTEQKSGGTLEIILDLVQKLEVKDIRQFLNGMELNISISFKDTTNE